MFNSKEKKAKKAQEEEAAKANAEFEAKFTAKQERKKVEKIVGDMDKIVDGLMQRAMVAKQKGYTDMYRSLISQIKVAKARKKQAEVFLFQVDTMQEMQTLSKSSTELLGSMSAVMNSLGKLSLDKSAMLSSQRDFASAQRELDKQTATIDTFLSGMEMNLPDDDASYEQFSDSAIEAEIDAMMGGSAAPSTGSAGSFASSDTGSSSSGDLDYLKRMLEN